MASAKLIRSASNRKVRVVTDADLDHENENEPLLGSRVPRASESENAEVIENDPATHPYPYGELPVYDNIWRIRSDILDAINDPYTLEQIRSPRLTVSIVRPLLYQYYELNDISIVFCLLLNRMYFLSNQSFPHHYQSVNTTRAVLCEVLAGRLLRQFDEASSGPNGLLLLANIVIVGFEPFQNCPDHLTSQSTRNHWVVQERGGYEKRMNALELAILSESKIFLSSPACQKVVHAIYSGRIVYTATSFIDILPDHYKHKTISLYNPRKEHILNQYRLTVPRVRNIIEVVQFTVLLGLYFWVMSNKKDHRFTFEETIFCIYTFGWTLDQLASILEHGWTVYSQNLWSFLDITFVVIFMIYFFLRMEGLHSGSIKVSQPALDILALAAPFLVPRLAFNLFSENLVFVSLRDMMAKFVLLMFLAVWSFTGFFLAMYWLGEKFMSPILIAKWMVWVWFGLDGTGIQESVQFHWLLGPAVMVAFAVLGNTLFLTILVSTLSDSFSRIRSQSGAEVQFRRAVLTFLAVKSDAIFAYFPPFNILALIILLPLKMVVTPRWFHKINVTAVRVLNAPLLLGICLYERRTLWPTEKEGIMPMNQIFSNRFRTGGFQWFRVHGDVEAVFENPPEHIGEEDPDFRPVLSRDSRDSSLGPPGTGSAPVRKSISRSRSRGKQEVVEAGTKTMERRLSRIEEMLGRLNETVVEDEDD